MDPSPFTQILTKGVLKEELSQGDIITDPSSDITGIFEPPPLGFAVASNTCDLVQRGKMSYVFLSPIFGLDRWLKDILRQQIARIKGSGGANPNYDWAINFVIPKLHGLANYEDKWFYFIPPHEVLEGSASFVGMDQTSPFPIAYYNELLAARVATIKSPWKEKFGFKVGYLFNRVATPTPDPQEVLEWLDASYGNVIREILEP